MEVKKIIHTGLESFSLLDGIMEIDEGHVKAGAKLGNAPLFLAMEAMAQAGAIHVRYVNEFQRHGFLLGINRFRSHEKIFHGHLEINARVEGGTGRAYSYTVIGSIQKEMKMEGRFTFAVVEYGDRFRERPLKEHYKRIFNCLRKD